MFALSPQPTATCSRWSRNAASGRICFIVCTFSPSSFHLSANEWTTSRFWCGTRAQVRRPYEPRDSQHPRERHRSTPAAQLAGNIRELQNFVERAVILTSGPVLCAPLGGLRGCTGEQASAAGNQTLADAERSHILEVLRQVDWMVGGRRGAAVRLGLPRTTLFASYAQTWYCSRRG